MTFADNAHRPAVSMELTGYAAFDDQLISFFLVVVVCRVGPLVMFSR